MSFYLDASVIVSTLIDERTSDVATRWLAALDQQAAVGELTRGEVVSAIHRAVRAGRHSLAQAETELADFESWRAHCQAVDHLPADVRTAVSYVQRFDLALRMPAALHLAACARLRLTLATFDPRLVRAAKDVGVLTVVPA